MISRYYPQPFDILLCIVMRTILILILPIKSCLRNSHHASQYVQSLVDPRL